MPVCRNIRIRRSPKWWSNRPAISSNAGRNVGVEVTSRTSVHPSPYLGIIEAAETGHCDVIFMASHGRRGLGSLLIGSETQRVLTHTKIPVIVYR
jgi:nucleotide-binding universal stress UspA family protein